MFSFFKKHTVLMSVTLILVVIIAVIAGRQSTKSLPTTSQSDKKVNLVDASTLRTDSARISADGAIESSAQVELRSQISAPVTAVNVSIGDFVSAGEVLVTLQNSDLLAGLDQANANLALAKAQSSNAGISVDSANKSAIDKIQDAYVKVDDAVHTQADQFFSNPTSGNPQLVFTTSNSQLVNNIQSDRLSLELNIKTWKELLANLSTTMSDSELDQAINLAEKNLGSVGSFLDEVSTALNNVIVSSPTVAAALPNWKISISAARANISGAIAGLTGIETSLAQARSALKNPNDSSQGNAPSTTEAQVMAAEAAVQNLKVQLAKTIIKAPISGRVGSIGAKVGELVSPGQVVAFVLNPQSLQVKAYVSDSDYPKISYGSVVVIDGGAAGVVTKIAPSIDPQTKKVEVKIAIDSGKTSGLVIGQNVHVEIIGKIGTESGATYFVPIQDVKIIPGEAFVFTVSPDSKVQKKPVILGEVKGDFVEIKSGMDDSMKIVSPVYGLEEGDKVIAE